MTIENSRHHNLPKAILANLFFTGEPYAGLLTAVSILFVLTQVCLWLLLFPVQSSIVSRLWIALGTAFWMVLYALSLMVVAFRNLLQKTCVKFFGALGCSLLFLPFGVLALLIHAWRRRRLLSAGLLAVSLLIFLIEVAASCGYLGKIAINYNYLIYFKLVIILIAILLLPLRPTFRMAYALVPLALFAWVTWRLHVEDHRLNAQIAQQREAISELVGLPMEQSDYRARMEAGFSLEDEPLKSLIAHAKKLNDEPIKDLWPGTPADELTSRYQTFLQDSAEFVQALDAWLELPTQHIAHVWSDESAYSILLPELSAFRNAARFLALKMQANSDSPEMIHQCNYGMKLLRDETLSGDTLISALVGIAIEAIRLDALTATLDHSRWSQEEWLALLGDEPDWNFRSMKALADESSAFDTAVEYIWNAPMNLEKLGGITPPPGMKTQNPTLGLALFHWILKFDSLYRLEYIRQNIECLQNHPHPYDKLHALSESSAKSIKERFYLLSSMLLPAVNNATMKFDQIHDRRVLAYLAWEVVHYRDMHDGQLPESLDFLGEIPVSSITGKPFAYETGEVPCKLDNGTSQEGDSRTVHGFRLIGTIYDQWNYPQEKQFYLVVPLKTIQSSNE